jgi:hypothetical protein
LTLWISIENVCISAFRQLGLTFRTGRLKAELQTLFSKRQIMKPSRRDVLRGGVSLVAAAEITIAKPVAGRLRARLRARRKRRLCVADCWAIRRLGYDRPRPCGISFVRSPENPFDNYPR